MISIVRSATLRSSSLSPRTRSYTTMSSSMISRRLYMTLATTGLSLTTLLLLPTAQAESTTPLPAIQQTPTITLLRSYLVYTLCTFPSLIDSSPKILKRLTTSPIPGIKEFTELIVRYTFFAQFVPGESVRECIPSMKDLRGRGIGSVLNYSAEAEIEGVGGDGDGEEQRGLERRRLEEVERALDEAGEFERSVEEVGGMRGSTAFALKITGLIDPAILARASTTLLRLHPVIYSNTPSSPSSAPTPTIPYPGTPLSTDCQVVAPQTRPSLGLNDTGKALFSLKGAVESMGVLDTDEGIREGDLEELKIVWEKIRFLAEKARSKGVKLMIDAEHTWYQPVLDAFTLLLSEEFNRPPQDPKRSSMLSSSSSTDNSTKWSGPLIFGTYQSYLTRQPSHLKAAIEHAEKNGYALGIKLVRGAYFVQERQKWKDEERIGADPIWPDKLSTDMAYNSSIKTILSTMARQLKSPHPELALSVVFGTHNSESCDIILETLVDQGLASTNTSRNVEGVKGDKKLLRLNEEVRGKVFIAQLYGMKDDLTDRMAESFVYEGMPVALKYIAYGSLGEVMPFLGRRAIENKSMMSGEGGAAAERLRISRELRRRWFGGA